MSNTSAVDNYLVIDDDEVFAQILARSLTRLGKKVGIAHDDAGALEANRLQLPRRIVLDLKLEHSSGLHLIQQLKAANPRASIVILTGYSSIATAVEAIKLGAEHYLCKPASVEEIINAFEKTTGDPETSLAENPPSIDRMEWEHIQRVLEQHDGNVSATARSLGMHRRTLQRKLNKKPRRD